LLFELAGLLRRGRNMARPGDGNDRSKLTFGRRRFYSPSCGFYILRAIPFLAFFAALRRMIKWGLKRFF
jgi:hypothetical protein